MPYSPGRLLTGIMIPALCRKPKFFNCSTGSIPFSSPSSRDSLFSTLKSTTSPEKIQPYSRSFLQKDGAVFYRTIGGDLSPLSKPSSHFAPGQKTTGQIIDWPVICDHKTRQAFPPGSNTPPRVLPLPLFYQLFQIWRKNSDLLNMDLF